MYILYFGNLMMMVIIIIKIVQQCSMYPGVHFSYLGILTLVNNFNTNQFFITCVLAKDKGLITGKAQEYMR